jgi:hypothetical protein
MHAASKSHRVVRIVCAGNDTVVLHALPMKPLKIGMVVGQHGTLLPNGVCENFRITNTLASPTRVVDRAHAVPEAAQFLDNRQGKILVRIEPGHEGSVRLIDTNVVVDFSGMLSVIVPSGPEVFGREAHDVL